MFPLGINTKRIWKACCIAASIMSYYTTDTAVRFDESLLPSTEYVLRCVWQDVAQACRDVSMWSPVEIKPPLEGVSDLLHPRRYRTRSRECVRFGTGTHTQPLVVSCSCNTCFSAVPAGAYARFITHVCSFFLFSKYINVLYKLPINEIFCMGLGYYPQSCQNLLYILKALG